ncbi:MAG: hypothetical protein ACPGYJ_11455, partial [bacterium]
MQSSSTSGVGQQETEESSPHFSTKAEGEDSGREEPEREEELNSSAPMECEAPTPPLEEVPTPGSTSDTEDEDGEPPLVPTSPALSSPLPEYSPCTPPAPVASLGSGHGSNKQPKSKKTIEQHENEVIDARIAQAMVEPNQELYEGLWGLEYDITNPIKVQKFRRDLAMSYLHGSSERVPTPEDSGDESEAIRYEQTESSHSIEDKAKRVLEWEIARFRHATNRSLTPKQRALLGLRVDTDVFDFESALHS